MHKHLLFIISAFFAGFIAMSSEISWFASLRSLFGSESSLVSFITAAFFAGSATGFLLSGFLIRKYKNIRRFLVMVFIAIIPVLICYSTSVETLEKLCLALRAEFMYKTALYIGIFLILLVPSILFGLMLPLLTALSVRQEIFQEGFAPLYAALLAGSGLGCISASLILPKTGIKMAIAYSAALAFIPAILVSMSNNRTLLKQESVKREKGFLTLHAHAFLLGTASLGFEILILRIFSIFFIPTELAISLIITVYLTGSSLGSFMTARFRRQHTKSRYEQLIAVAGIVMVICISISFPLCRFLSSKYSDASFIAKSVPAFLVSLFCLLPVSFLTGACFPLLEKLNPKGQKPGLTAARILFWNTIGSMTGALLCGGLVIKELSHTFPCFSVCLAAIIGAGMFTGGRKHYWPQAVFPVVLYLIVFYMSSENRVHFRKDVRCHREIPEGSISVLQGNRGERDLVFGKSYILGSSSPQALRIQITQGIMPFLFASETGKILKLGLGTGITMNSIIESGLAEKALCVELLDLDPCLDFFSEHNSSFLETDSCLHKGDARSFLLRDRNKYDIIIGELFSPQISGTGYMYTIEHFQTVSSHLADKGVFCQYLQLGQFTEPAFSSVIKTFEAVFPGSTLWLVDPHPLYPVVAVINKPVPSSQDLDKRLSSIKHAQKRTCNIQFAPDLLYRLLSDNLSQLFLDRTALNTADRNIVEYLVLSASSRVKKSPFFWIFPSQQDKNQEKREQGIANSFQIKPLLEASALLAEGRMKHSFKLLNQVKQPDSTFAKQVLAAYYSAISMYNLEKGFTFTELPPYVKESRSSTLLQARWFLEKACTLDPGFTPYLNSLISVLVCMQENRSAHEYMKITWQMLTETERNSEEWQELRKTVQVSQ